MTIDTQSKIVKKLDTQEKEEGSLPLLLQFYRDLVYIQAGAEKHIGVPNVIISGEAINKRIQRGFPLLGFKSLDINWKFLQDVFVKVCAVFAKYTGLFGELPEKLKGPGSGRLLTKKVVTAWFNGKPLPQTALTESVDNGLIQALIHATLKPFLASHSKVLTGFIDPENWRRRYCPVCGGAPDFAYLDTERGSRWLLCSRCDTEWLYKRLECPYCDTTNQDDLLYFTDDEGAYRLYVCEHCKRYLKAVDFQKTSNEVLLPLERLLTLDLDRQAQQKGYVSST